MGVVFTAHALYAGGDRVDVTSQGDRSGEPFAPSLELRMKALDWRFDPAQSESAWVDFVVDYRREVRLAVSRDPALWQSLLDRDSLTLVCFCTRPDRCHRTLLAEMLAEDGASYAGERPFPYGSRPSERVDAGPEAEAGWGPGAERRPPMAQGEGGGRANARRRAGV